MAYEEEVRELARELSRAEAEGDPFALTIIAVLQVIETSYNLERISLREAGREFTRQVDLATARAQELGWI
ncbi:MAG: hypothetical protein HYS86_00875 [Candidatus Chisholmbacteria bacterium]|nr:hypothetical protein [Candidatus Chisholmbacteria bacterium]